MGSNMGFGAVKELLPDLGRAIARKRKKPIRTPEAAACGEETDRCK
jgi:hypothetical protein